LKLLAMPSMSVLLDTHTSQPTDAAVAEPHSAAAVITTVASEMMSLESSMTDDDSSHADITRQRRPRRHRGADDVFPTHAIHRQQVC